MLIEAFGDDALTVRTGERQETIQARAVAFRASGAFEAVVPTLGALTVVFGDADAARAERAVRRLLAEAPRADAVDAAPLVLPVIYDGDDLPWVADTLGMSVSEVAAIHANGAYAVQFLGFTPGFAYLGGLPPPICGVPRLGAPRTRTPGGSIGMVGDRSCVYGLPGPGGWPIIGRTDAALFQAGQADPFILTPGRAVRFEAVR